MRACGPALPSLRTRACLRIWVHKVAGMRAPSMWPQARYVIAMYVSMYRSYRRMSLRYLSNHEKKRSTTPRLACVHYTSKTCPCCLSAAGPHSTLRHHVRRGSRGGVDVVQKRDSRPARLPKRELRAHCESGLHGSTQHRHQL